MQARGLLIPSWRVDLLDMFLMDDGDSSVDKLSDAEGRRVILLTENMPEYDWKIRRVRHADGDKYRQDFELLKRKVRIATRMPGGGIKVAAAPGSASLAVIACAPAA